MFDAILKVLTDEIEFYNGKENPDWSHDKNEGFMKGIEYSKMLIIKMKESIR